MRLTAFLAARREPRASRNVQGTRVTACPTVIEYGAIAASLKWGISQCRLVPFFIGALNRRIHTEALPDREGKSYCDVLLTIV